MGRTPDGQFRHVQGGRSGRTVKRKGEIIALGLILLAGLLVRVAYLLENQRTPDFRYPAVDAGYHDYWARALATGDWSLHHRLEYDPRIPEMPFFRPPGYPYFLAGIYRLLGPGYLAPRVVQHGLGLGNILLLYLLARRWIGRGTALAAAAMMAVYWIPIYFEGEFLEPVLLIALMLLMFLVLGSMLAPPGRGKAFGAGLLLAVSALVRPNVLPFALFVVVWLVWVSGWSRKGWGWAIWFGAGCAAGVLPVAVRNGVVGHDWVLISSNAGINLYIGNNPVANGGFVDIGDGSGGGFGTSDVYPAILGQLEKQAGRPMKSSEASGYFAKQAGRFIRENPGRFLGLLGVKTLLFWGNYEAGHNKSLHYEKEFSPVLSRLPLDFSAVLALALLGWACPWVGGRVRAIPDSGRDRDRRAMMALLGGYALFQYASFLPFFVTGQYRAPVLPVVFVFAGWGIEQMADLGRARRWIPLCGMGLLGALLYGILAHDYLGVRRNPSEWHQARGQAWSRAGRAELAVEEYRRALAADPGNASTHYNLANALMKTGRSEEARKHFEEALRRRPDFGRAAFNLALALNEAGDRAGAKERLREALALMPELALAHLQLGNLLLQEGDAAGARSEFEAAVEQERTNEMAWRALAYARKAAGDRGAAMATLRQALQACPDSVVLRNSLAWELATDPATSREGLRESEALAEGCVARDPENAGYHDTWAAVLARQGRFGEARERAVRALQLARKNGSARDVEMVERNLRRYEADQPYTEP